MSKKDEITDLAAQALEVWEQGAEMMWRNAIADTVLEILEAKGKVTRGRLRAALEAKSDAKGCTNLERATLRGALNALDGRPPVS